MNWFESTSAEVGIRITCKACKQQVFLRQIGYGSVDAAMAHRHSVYDEFEPMPKDWEFSSAFDGFVCGDCLRERNKNIEKLNRKCNDE